MILCLCLSLLLGLELQSECGRRQEQFPEERKPADLRPGHKEGHLVALQKAWGQLSVLCTLEQLGKEQACAYSGIRPS